MNDSLTTESVEWQVTGMDCAACAGKIQTAVAQLPGVHAPQVTLMAERLRLGLSPGGATAEDVERTVRSLGFGLGPVQRRREPDADADTGAQGHAHEPRAPSTAAPLRWYRLPKGRLVLTSGALLAASWALSLRLAPGAADWAFALACLVALAPVARAALTALRAGMPFTIEMLMTIAATGALLIGEAREAALVVFLFAVGELLEGVATNKARDSIRALARLVPATARLEHGDHSHEVTAETLVAGQVIRLRPGDRLAVDAEIIEGTSGLDESAVTGESLPVAKAPGDSVPAGAVNIEALLRLRVLRPASDSTLARIARLVAEAEAARAPTERFIDRFSRWYMPLIVAVAALVAVVPPLATAADWGDWIYRALALLLIGCPCALVISVPAAMASALSTGARNGLLVKGGAVLEAMATLRHVALDKTGTLTEGKAVVTDVLPAEGVSAADLLRLAAAVEGGSSHPLARAILSRAAAEGLALPATQAARAIPGRGVLAEVEGAQVGVMAAAGPQVAALEEMGKTVVQVTRRGQPLGLIALRDDPRPEATEALRQIRALGLSAVMLTGDNPRAAAAIGDLVGVPQRAGLLPEDKLAQVRGLAATGGVMMVGDGINDAPALSAATVGVAMGAGTDVALETADAAILRNRLTDLPAMVRLSRRAMQTVRQNVAVALGLKAVFLVTTVMGVTGLWIAVLADTGATVLVTLNAMRLLRLDPRADGRG